MAERTSVVFDQLQMLAMGFLLPGLVPLFALATISPAVSSWFGNASTAPTLAGVFFVVMGALAVGFVLTAVRWAIYERPYFGLCFVRQAPEFDQSKRSQFEEAYRDLRQSYYYHYLAYANLSIAIPFGVLLWTAGTVMHSNDVDSVKLGGGALFGLIAMTMVITVLLGQCACEAVRRYDDRRGQLLGFKTPAA